MTMMTLLYTIDSYIPRHAMGRPSLLLSVALDAESKSVALARAPHSPTRCHVTT